MRRSYCISVGIVTKDKELSRLTKELDRVEKDLIIVSKKLSDSKFVERATKEIVDKTRTQRQNLSEMKNKLLVAKKFANEL